jgi:hypothetical protein
MREKAVFSYSTSFAKKKRILVKIVQLDDSEKHIATIEIENDSQKHVLKIPCSQFEYLMNQT